VPYLYIEDEKGFGDKGADKGSTAGGFYDELVMFGKVLGYTDYDVLTMPVRRRKKMETALAYHLEEEAKQNKKAGAFSKPRMPGRRR